MTRSHQCLASGKVQGVFFRAWTQEQASSLGLFGWVRNLADGKVEVLLQGDEDKVEEMRKRLLSGPTMARVDDLQCKWIDYDKAYDSFEIRS